MTFRVNAQVIEIQLDNDPFGGEYAKVTLAYRLPVPTPPVQGKPGLPKTPIVYKHVAHIIIPKDAWVGQYNMWHEFEVEVKDDGTVTIRRPGAKQ